MHIKNFIVFLSFLLITLMQCTSVFAKNYTDTSGHWGNEAIQNWSNYGVVNGYNDNQFKPDNGMTRAELAQTITNLLKLKADKNNKFDDVKESDWFYDAVSACAKEKIILGKGDKTFAPDSIATREEAIVMLCRALNILANNVEVSNYKDSSEISDWAEGYVSALVSSKIVNGVTEDSLLPKGTITRAQALTILNRAVTSYINETGKYNIDGSNNGIVLVVSDNAKITGNIKGNLIIAQGASEGTVEISDANIEKSVIVLGADTEIIIKDNSEVQAINILGNESQLSVDDSSEVNNINIDTKGADVAINGKTQNITVTGNAENTEISGKGEVKKVEVESGALKTDISTNNTEVKAEVGSSETSVYGTDIKAGETVISKKPTSSGGGGSSSEEKPNKKVIKFDTLDLTQDMFTAKVDGFKEKYYNKPNENNGSSGYMNDKTPEEGYFIISGEGITSDYIKAISSVKLNGTEIASGEKAISVGNDNWIKRNMYKVTEEGLKVALPIVTLEKPNANNQLVFTINATGYEEATATIEVPATQGITLNRVYVAGGDALSIDSGEGKHYVSYNRRIEGYAGRLIALEFSGDNFNPTAETIYFTKKKVSGGNVTYGFTAANDKGIEGRLGLYALNDTTLEYTVATLDRFGCETVTLVFGKNENRAPKFDTLNLTQEMFIEKVVDFKEEYYNKPNENGGKSGYMNDKTPEEGYFIIPGEGITSDYIKAITSVKLDDIEIASGEKAISVGNDNWIKRNLYKVTEEGLKVSLPIVALEKPDSNKQLVFTIKATGYEDITATIKVPETQGIILNRVYVAGGDALSIDSGEGKYYVNYNRRVEGYAGRLIALEFVGDNFTPTAETIYFTKKEISGGNVSYGFTAANDKGIEGRLGLYAYDNTELKYTVATLDRFGCETVTLVFGENKDKEA